VNKPVSCSFNQDRQTSTLFFVDEAGKRAGEYYVRGSVCFPLMIESPGARDGARLHDIVGFALLACQDVETGVVTVFEQQEFAVIDHIIRDSEIAYTGLCTWFNECWSRYFCRKYFYFHRDHEYARKFRLDIHRSMMIAPKPEMIELEIYDDSELNHVIWSYVKTQRLVYERDSTIHVQMKQLRDGDKAIHPAIYALQVLLCGLDRFPYRKRTQGA